MAFIKKITSLTDKLKKTKGSKLRQAARKSIDWFKNNVNGKVATLLDTSSPRWAYKHLKGADKELKQSLINKNYPEIGSLYFYLYDPKFKGSPQLPYYDTLPLTFLISYSPRGFLGLNLHYLPPLLRAQLMDTLLSFKATYNDPVFGKRQYIKMSYDLLKGVGTTVWKPTIKRYLWTHVRSNFAYVPSEEWENAVFLPAEQFKKKTKREVWAESRDMVK